MPLPSCPIVLKGKDAEKFDRYNSRPATSSELKYVKDADKFYASHALTDDCPSNLRALPPKRK
ncbi:MAG: hypothetical protein KGH61_01715 [Candidatus Micrarchaeota archaeon]|nr:hypothetical protein [Candidatus Micrarchaeota archaeon]MDE1847647.1 hypothetical protein [Candidatus Micrarchaeota archaeon]MDE1864468.1 hypothetical protein [Candidatus Micrarchaeota archaeon]